MNILRFGDWISTNFILLDSSIHDESNVGKIIFLRSILTKLFHFENIIIFYYNFIFSNQILMNFISLDLSWKNKLNGSKIIFLQLILIELFHFEVNLAKINLILARLFTYYVIIYGWQKYLHNYVFFIKNW